MVSPFSPSGFHGDCIEELSGSGADFTAKYKGENLRRLSMVGRSGGCEMGSDRSGQDKFPSTLSAKKLKPHKKVKSYYFIFQPIYKQQFVFIFLNLPNVRYVRFLKILVELIVLQFPAN